MKRKFLLLIFIAQFLACLYIGTSSAKAQSASDSTKAEKQIDINPEINYLRHYIWRGANFGNNNVSQSYVSASYKKWSLNLSCNYNLLKTDVPSEYYTKKVHYDEQDIQITYADNFHKLQFECNAFAYLYFHQINTPSTGEITFKLIYPISEKWSVFSDNVTDIWSHKGLYYNSTGVDADFTIKNNYELETQVYSGLGNKFFNNAYYNSSVTALNFVGFHTELTRSILKTYYLKCFIEFNQYLDKRIVEANGINHTSNFGFSFGKNISYKIKKHLHKQIK